MKRLVAAVLLAGACSTDRAAGVTTTSTTTTTAPTTPVPAIELAGRSFVATAVTGFELVAGTQLTVDFGVGELTANAGCNSLRGGWSLDGGFLFVDDLAMTELGCDPRTLHDQETWLSSLLRSNPFVALEGDTLTLTAGGSSITFTAQPSTTSPPATTAPPFDAADILEGSDWELDAFYDGDEAVAVPRGVRDSTIQFEGGVATLDTSCNTGSVDYAVAGDQVTFQSLVITEIACDPLAASVEEAVVDTLDGATTVTFAAGVLFIDREDRRLVYLAERRD